jgi:hypothetical protein
MRGISAYACGRGSTRRIRLCERASPAFAFERGLPWLQVL